MTKKTSGEWEKELGILVLDPDGWNRGSFNASWHELITRSEFLKRAQNSTVIFNQELIDDKSKKAK